VATGSVFRWKTGGLAIVSELAAVEPLAGIAWTGRTLGARAEHEWRFEAVPGGTLVQTRERFAGWLPWLLPGTMRRRLERALEQGVAALKAAAESEPGVALADGLYLVLGEWATADSARAACPGAALRPYDRRYTGGEPEPRAWLALDPAGSVPLELAEPPSAASDGTGRALLAVRLAPGRVDQLAAFTAQHLDRAVAVVAGDEAITAHRIRAAITDGRLQITRCDERRCEALRLRLAD